MWAEFLLRNKPIVLTAVLILITAAGYGVTHLSFSSDTRDFFNPKDQRMANLLKFEETFQPTRKVLFVLHSKTSIESDSLKRSALAWLSAEISKLPGAMRVDSLATVSYPYDDNGEVFVDPYLDYICPESRCIEERAIILSQPLVQRRLVSSDNKTLGLIGIFNVTRNATERLSTIAKAANELKNSFKSKFPGIDVYLTGGIPVSQAYVEAGRRDVTTLFAFAGLIIVILLRVILGGFRNTLIILSTALAAVLVSMGIGGWIGLSINSATSTVPIIILTLVVASSMHLFTHYLRLCGSGETAELAVRAALNANVRPILMTTVTTALSLGSLYFINSPPVQEVGLLAGIGIVVGGLFAVTLAPLLLNANIIGRNTRLNEILQRKLNSYAKRLERGSKEPYFALLVLSMFAVGLSSLHVDDDFVAYLSDRTEVRRDTDFALKHLAGPSHIELHIKSETTVFDPQFLGELQDLTNRLRKLNYVASASSLSDVMENIVLAFGESTRLRQLNEEALSQYFFVYELGLRAGDSATDLVSLDHQETHIPLLLSSTSAKDVRSIEAEISDWLNDYPKLNVTLTGENSPVAHLSSSNIPTVTKTVIFSLALTIIGLGLYFRNWKTGVIAFLAITIPIICGLGAWGWLSESIGLSGTIIIAIALGIVIDDAIHLIYQQSESANRGDGAWEATAYSIHRVGVAIVATTALFVVGLSPLLMSNFQVNITFATVTILILLVSLLFDLAVLPRLLVWSTKKPYKDDPAHQPS